MHNSTALTRKPVHSTKGFSAIPNSYFDVLAGVLSPAAFVMVGQILRRQDWGEPCRGRAEWVHIDHEKAAHALDMSSGGIRLGLQEAENLKCIRSRKIGRRVEYQCLVENFEHIKRPGPQPVKLRPSLKTVEISETEPVQKPRAAIRIRVRIPCPVGKTCPVDELVQIENGSYTYRPENGRTKGENQYGNDLLKTKDLTQSQPQCSVVIEDSPVSASVQRIKGEDLRALVEAQLLGRLGSSPSDKLLSTTLDKLAGSSLEHFGAILAQRSSKITSWGILPHLAEDCARASSAWQDIPTSGLRCKKCGASDDQILLVDGRCGACRSFDREPVYA